MDPFTALRTAAASIQFIDYSAALVSTSSRTCRSKSGELQRESEEARTVAEELVDHSREMEDARSESGSDQTASDTERQIRVVCDECGAAAQELFHAVRKLKGRRLCRKEKFETFREALETVWSHDEIEQLQKSLENWRSRLIILTVSALRELQTLRGCQVPLLQSMAVQNSRNGQRFLECLENHAEYSSGIQEAIRANPRPAEEVFTLASSDEFETGILSTLWFSTMHIQEEKVREPCEGTLEWIFREPSPDQNRFPSFVDWLREDSSQPIYWITGKAGAGKSALMKFICSHENTDQMSREWADSERLIHAQCYIRNCDVSMQVLKKRLLRTLLYKCLRQDQTLVARTFPVQWEMFTLLGMRPDSSMTELDLQQALERMIKCNLDTRFIFFVDGLDELEESSHSMVALFKKLALNSNIKICLSSRPRVNFRDAYVSGPGLRLEDLNHPDIMQFAQFSLEKSTDFAHLCRVYPKQAQALVQAIADKAEGVFLWARVVIHILLQGLQDGERLSDLQRRLDSTPGGLEPLFERMLESIEPERVEHASQIFQIVRAARAPIDLLSLSFADEDDDALPYEHPIEPLTQDQEDARSDQMRRRLHTHCKGLLEVSPSPPNTAAATVDHLHRTVRDFLHRPDIWTRLTSSPRNNKNNPPFKPHLSLAHSSLLRLKSARLSTPAQHHSHDPLLRRAIHHLSALERAAAGHSFHQHLWDALAHTTQVLAERAGPCNTTTTTTGPGGCWCRGAADHPDGVFLPLAVRMRALAYVEYRLGRTWMRVQPDRVEAGAAPVLWFAVAGRGELGEEEYEDEDEEEEERDGEADNDDSRARLIGLLLEWGADPNFRAGVERSPWEEVVEGGGVAEYGEEVWEEMLRYGADRKVVIGLERGAGEIAGTGEKRKRRWMKRVWRREDGRMRWRRKVKG